MIQQSDGIATMMAVTIDDLTRRLERRGFAKYMRWLKVKGLVDESRILDKDGEGILISKRTGVCNLLRRTGA